MQTRIRSPPLAAFAPALFATPGLAKGPPWISIELPVNPYDQSMRGAFLLVHAFHHQTPMGFIVTGTAEGIVNGRSEEHTSELQSPCNLVCRLLLEKKKKQTELLLTHAQRFSTFRLHPQTS